MTAVMSLFILLSIGFGAFLLGRRFRIYSFITLIIVIVFGILTSMQIPRLLAGQSTPFIGITERINIYSTMTWFGVLALGLLGKVSGFSNETGTSGKFLLTKILLMCGIMASLLYGAMMIAIRYKGYDLASQTVSELVAIGAPTRPLWIPLSIAYDMLMVAFGMGLWISARRNRALRVVGIMLLFAYGAVGIAWPFAPMHMRGEQTSVTDVVHLVLGLFTVLSNLLAIGFGASAFGKPFRIYSIATILVLLISGTLMGIESPRVGANLPTSLVGIWERISIAGFMIWVVILALVLLWSEKGNGSVNVMITDRDQAG
jgi:hypothetical protein